MTIEEEARFLTNIHNDDCSAFYNMLGKIKSENSECYYDNDKIQIFDAIKRY